MERLEKQEDYNKNEEEARVEQKWMKERRPKPKWGKSRTKRDE